jgi:hypothetical protein
MIEIQIKDGKIAEQNRVAAGKFFAERADGDYMLFVCKLGDPLPEMEKIINWFSSVPIDFADYSTLQIKMNSFAAYLFRFSSVVGAACLDEARLISAYKSKFALKKKAYRERGEKIGDAETLATEDCNEDGIQMLHAKAYTDLLKSQMRSAEKVFTAMQMHLATLRKEKTFTESAGHLVPQY